MKNNVIKLLAVFLIICFGIVNIPIIASAEDNENNDVYSQIVDQKVNEYHSKNSPDVQENECSGVLEVYNKIYALVYDEDADTFNELYGGAYVDEAGNLVVNYVGNKNELLDLFMSNSIQIGSNVVFEQVEISYNTLNNAKKKLDQEIRNESLLKDKLVYYHLDNKNNSLHVILNPELSSASTKGDNTTEMISNLLGKDASVNIIVEYKNFEIVSAVDSIKSNGKKENRVDEVISIASTQAIYPGQVVHNDYVNENNEDDFTVFSVGMRGQYIGSNGVPYFGFITVSHGFEGSNDVYIYNRVMRKIGEKKWNCHNIGLGVDVAFVALNAGYEMTNTVFFANYLAVNDSYSAYQLWDAPATNGDCVYSNYYTNMPENYAVYTNGSTTGRTSGRVIAYDATITTEGEYGHHFAIISNPCALGDSGGIVYSNVNGNGTYEDYITVGIVTGVGNLPSIGTYTSVMTYSWLRQAVSQYQSQLGNITFLTIY